MVSGAASHPRLHFVDSEHIGGADELRAERAEKRDHVARVALVLTRVLGDPLDVRARRGHSGVCACAWRLCVVCVLVRVNSHASMDGRTNQNGAVGKLVRPASRALPIADLRGDHLG